MDHMYPLTFGQVAVLRDHLRNRGRDWVTTLTAAWAVPAGVSQEAVRGALVALAGRHDSLRTAFGDLGSPHPVQFIQSSRGEFDIATVAEAHATRLPGLVVFPGEGDIKPFDLETGRTWRARIVEHGGAPTGVRVEIHRMAVDVSGCDILYQEFLSLLAGLDLPPAPRPVQLALDQRSEAWLRRNDNAVKHFRKAYRDAALVSGFPQNATLPQWTGTIRSQRSLAGARAVAGRLGVQVTAVLLAAVSEAVGADLGYLPPILMMVSNRHVPGYQDVVSTMTQWVPLVVEYRPNESFEDSAVRLQGHLLRVLRNSCFDPDAAMAELRAVEAETGVKLSRSIAIDYIPGPVQGTTNDAPDPDSVQLRDGERSAPPGIFVKATEQGGFALTIAAAWESVGRPELEGILLRIHDRLTSGANPLGEGHATC